MSFVQGKRIGYNSTCTGFAMSGSAPSIGYSCTAAETPQQASNDKAVVTLANAGATLVPDPTFSAATMTSLPSGWEQHATIDEYYKGINPQGQTPTTLAGEVAYDNTDPQEAEKDGNGTHASESLSDDSTITSGSSPTALGTYNQAAFDAILPYRKIALHSAIDTQLACPGSGVTTNTTTTINLPTAMSPSGPVGGPTTVQSGSSSCPAGTVNPVIAVIGSTSSSSPAAGYPEMVVPGGYTPTQRRPIGVDITAGPYHEYDIVGIGYVLEQSQHLQQPPAMVDPASYRCAHTVPAEPFAGRGHCNPDYQSVMSMLDGEQTILPFPLETASAAQLEAKLAAGTLTSQQLVKAELTRIALANAEGPAIQAIRALNPNAISDAIASDKQRAKHGPRGSLDGIPFVVDDSIDAAGLPTSDGSIALQDNVPSGDSTLVSRLRAAGAILLGDANITELGAMMQNANMPQGYSSLGGQVLLAGDTNKNIGGSSGGSADSVATGFAPLAVGLETSTDSAQAITPAGNAGVVALKPTVGLVSRSGVLGVAKSQDSPTEIGQTVTDVANELTTLAGPDPSDPATAGAPSGVNYATGLTGPIGLTGTTVGVIASTAAPYPAAVAGVTGLGGTVVTFTPPTGTTGTTASSIIPYEFHKQIDSSLAASPEASHGGPASLQDIITYNNAHPVEGLKFQQDGLTGAEGVNYTDAGTNYQANLAQGRSDTRAVIDGLLSSTGSSVLMVPSGSGLVNIADRAGYPVLTIPAGYGAQNSNAGGDPIGVVLIGTADSEPTLLKVGYELEQGMNVRNSGPAYMISATVPNPGFSGAPSETFQSDWRCVAGSAFFSPYDCNAGDVQGHPVPGFGTLGPRGNM